MRDPYEVLGLERGASESEIKKAYKELVKKYHPDQYRDNPLSGLAEEKLKEINEAYSILMKNGSGYSQSNYSGSYDNAPGFYEVRQNIMNGNIAEAERILNSIGTRTAEWYFLRGMIDIRKGYYSQGYSNINTAVNMDPGNPEYRQTLNNLNANTRQYNTYRTTNTHDSSADICNICTTLYCMDCCCECMGGDFISCC